MICLLIAVVFFCGFPSLTKARALRRLSATLSATPVTVLEMHLGQLSRDLMFFRYNPGIDYTVAPPTPGLEFHLGVALQSELDAGHRGSRRVRSWKGSTAHSHPALAISDAACINSKVQRLQPRLSLLSGCWTILASFGVGLHLKYWKLSHHAYRPLVVVQNSWNRRRN